MYGNKITLCVYGQEKDGSYSFSPVLTTFAKEEKSRASNLFTRVGSGSRTTLFYMRRVAALAPWTILQAASGSYLVTEISEEAIFVTVTTASVTPIKFKAIGDTEDSEAVLYFTGFLLPKYEGFIQADPMAMRESRLILSTPKGFELKAADIIVRLDTEPAEQYILQTEDFLARYQNEYSLYSKTDI